MAPGCEAALALAPSFSIRRSRSRELEGADQAANAWRHEGDHTVGSDGDLLVADRDRNLRGELEIDDAVAVARQRAYDRFLARSDRSDGVRNRVAAQVAYGDGRGAAVPHGNS